MDNLSLVVFLLAVWGLFLACAGTCTHLEGTTIKTLQVNTTVHKPLGSSVQPGLSACVQRCRYVKGCTSVNFAPSTKRCVLLAVTSGTATQVTSPPDVWKAVDMANLTQTLLPQQCASNNCLTGQTCYDNGSGSACYNINL